ncbi:hypothetical protein TNCV_2577571 [Trichonephila clavipes]|nr:hypothetical protein TNCV_2577571 [Trichonephila clavipes]
MSPDSRIGVVCKTANVCTNSLTTFAAEWTLGSNTMATVTVNAASQSGASSMTFLDTENVQLLPWPALSPDLTPIQNVWSIVSERQAGHHSPVTVVDEWWHRVEAAWAFVSVTPFDLCLTQCSGV